MDLYRIKGIKFKFNDIKEILYQYTRNINNAEYQEFHYFIKQLFIGMYNLTDEQKLFLELED